MNPTISMLQSEAVGADALEQRIIRQDAVAVMTAESESAFVFGHYLERLPFNAKRTSDWISHTASV
jgi:hypothetical protein